MKLLVINHIAYLAIAVPLTIWVARTLCQHGRIFLVDAFHGNEELADSVNRLLVVGFYLLNLGFVLLFLRQGKAPVDQAEMIEGLAGKIGLVMLFLGGMHFFNLATFNRLRKRAMAPKEEPIPPLRPTHKLATNPVA